MALVGLHLASKLPVILNWTTGPANLANAAKLMKLTHVVSSRAFIDRIAVTVEGTEYLYLEEIRKSMGKLEKLWALLTVRLRPGSVQSRVPDIKTDQPAVVLFTSARRRRPRRCR